MNILIKLTCLVGLVIAPILAQMSGNAHGEEKQEVVKEVVIEKVKNEVE